LTIPPYLLLTKANSYTHHIPDITTALEITAISNRNANRKKKIQIIFDKCKGKPEEKKITSNKKKHHSRIRRE
jgi:hypothetical protein